MDKNDLLKEVVAQNRLQGSQPSDEIELSDLKTDNVIEDAQMPKMTQSLSNKKYPEHVRSQGSQGLQGLQGPQGPQEPKEPREPQGRKISPIIIDYLIMPIILIFLFVLMVWPKTSNLIGKVLPRLKDMKGYLARGILLAILYLTVRYLLARTLKS